MSTRTRRGAGPHTDRTVSQGDSASAVSLTPRQLEVLALLCQGYSNKLICRQLDICPGTVKVHMAVIMRALGVSSRVQAVLEAHRLGLSPQDEDGEDFDAAALERPRPLAAIEPDATPDARDDDSADADDEVEARRDAPYLESDIEAPRRPARRLDASAKSGSERASDCRFSDTLLLATWR